VEGIAFPRLYMGFTAYAPELLVETDETTDELDDFICAMPFARNEQRRSSVTSDLELVVHVVGRSDYADLPSNEHEASSPDNC
jgi:hypothetical protein